MALTNLLATYKVSFGTATQYRIAGPITICTWFKPSFIGTTAQHLVSRRGGGSTTRGYSFAVSAGGNFTLGLWTTGLVEYGCNSGTALVAGTQYHLTGRYNGSNIASFKNGVASGTTTAFSGVSCSADASPLVVGNGPDGGAALADGVLFDTRVYNGALSDAEIYEIYAKRGCDSILDSRLVLRTCIQNGYVGNSLSGQTVYDHSIYKNHIIPTGAPTVAADLYQTVKAATRLPIRVA